MVQRQSASTVEQLSRAVVGADEPASATSSPTPGLTDYLTGGTLPGTGGRVPDEVLETDETMTTTRSGGGGWVVVAVLAVLAAAGGGVLLARRRRRR